MTSDVQVTSANAFWSWDTLTKIAALAALFVPAVGFVIRYLRFFFDPSVPLDAILATSTLNLLVTGAWGVAFSLFVGVAWIFLYGRLAVAQGHLNEAELELERSGLNRVDFDELQARIAALLARGQAIGPRQDQLNVRSKEIDTLGPDAAATLVADLAASKADAEGYVQDQAALTKEVDDLGAASVRTKDARDQADRVMGRLGRVRLPGRNLLLTKRRQQIFRLVLFALTTFGLSLFAPLFAVAVRVGGLTIAGEMGSTVADRGARKVPVVQLLPMVAVIVFSAALSDGLWPWQSQGRFVTFDGVPHVTDGWYGELGSDSNSLYLQSCDDAKAPVIAVPIARVTSTTYAPLRPQQFGTLGDLWAGRNSVGYVRGCAHPTNP
jgi:hypothetical protein